VGNSPAAYDRGRFIIVGGTAEQAAKKLFGLSSQVKTRDLQLHLLFSKQQIPRPLSPQTRL